MANRFVKDPYEIVKTGQIVKVKVLEVNVKRRRISPTMRLDDAPGASSRTADTRGQPSPRDRQPPAPKARRRASPSPAAIALALEVTSGSKDGLTTAYRLPNFIRWADTLQPVHIAPRDNNPRHRFTPVLDASLEQQQATGYPELALAE